MPKQGVVNIGLQVSYKESLDKMLNDFRATLKQVSNDAERIKWDSNMAKSFEAIQKRIDSVETDFKGMFDELNGQKLSTDKFEAYQKEISSSFEKIEADIKGLTGQFENLGNSDYVSKMISQFESLQETIKTTQNDLGKIVDFTSSSSVIDLDIVKQVGEYKKAIKDIQNLRDNAELPSVDLSDIEKAKQTYKELYDLFVSLESREFDLQDEFDASSADKKLSIERELYSVRQQMVNTLESLQELYSKIGSKNLGDFEDPNKIVAFDSKGIDTYIDNATAFIQQNEKMVESYKETQSQLDALVTEFKVKNGAIHVPIEIDKIGTNHKNQLMEALNKLQAELDKKNIIAKVKLTLDDGSSKGRKKNADFDQQQIDGQKKPSADLSPSIAKAYREGAKIAEESVKAGMAEIQKAFKDVPVTFKPDTDSFKSDLKAMIDDSLKAIAEDTTGIKVNEELEKLVTNLKEVSSSMSGNESFKFGLDEDSINSITSAIKNMADMIQRAFKVASNDDIDKQWEVLDSKFKAIAGEKDVLPKRTKEQKAAVQELAAEYKKYLDMGGKEDLSKLTGNRDSIRKIKDEYNKLNAEIKETQDVLAQKGTNVVLTPTGENFKADAEKILNSIDLEKDVKLKADATSLKNTSAQTSDKISEATSLGYDRFQKLNRIRESGTTGKIATETLLRLGHQAWDVVKANNFYNNIPEDGAQRITAIGKAVDSVVAQILKSAGLTENQIIQQLSNIQKASVDAFPFLKESSGWERFSTINKDGSWTKLPDKIYKIYAAFEDIKDLNVDNITQILNALSKAGFKGQLKTTTGSTGFADKVSAVANSDQLVVHAANKKSQEIAYNVLKNSGIKLSYLSGGFDTKDSGSFSQMLASGDIGKYVKFKQNAKSTGLGTQADKTSTSLKNEGDIAETAASQFEKLAEKKKAATDANLELGIAAEMTTNALKEEMTALKEAEQRKKTNKKAVDAGTYESNAPAWQKNIKQSLLDSGNYLEVYEGKLSRLESGTVRYTAFVRDSVEEGEESWKKLTATISSAGEIQSTTLQEITEKQFLKMEKQKKRRYKTG